MRKFNENIPLMIVIELLGTPAGVAIAYLFTEIPGFKPFSYLPLLLLPITKGELILAMAKEVIDERSN